MKRPRTTPGRPPRQDRRIAEHVHDPYMTRMKPADPSLCPDCGVVFHKGRWQWPMVPPPGDAPRQSCPACRRIADDYPAGWVTLAGRFAQRNRDEIVHLVRHQEEAERKEHPMHRIMDIGEEDGAIVVRTTDIHLPRRIGEAVSNAYRGDLDFHYDEETYRLRVRWTRDD
jgi:NMD protein affecting ribosome stability and mRNA decay